MERSQLLPKSSAEVRWSLSCSRILLQTCAVVSAAPTLDYSIDQYHSILNPPPYDQVLSGAPENALAVFESTLQSFRGAWEHLEILCSTRERYRSACEACVWLPDQCTFCGCLQTHSIMACKSISEFAPSRSLSTSLNWLDHSLRVNLETLWTLASKCISEFARFWPPSVSAT